MEAKTENEKSEERKKKREKGKKKDRKVFLRPTMNMVRLKQENLQVGQG